ncbi:ribonuclease T2 family protein [Pseudomonas sp. KCJK9111]|uniref:ribonuclease T2 family protein n=1 Tax=Pseudomonas sp. KCJK9111 TaxID=3344555 RepID=UPI003905C18B
MRLLTASLLLLPLVWINAAMALDANEEAYADAPPTRFLVYSVTWQPTFCKMKPTTAGCEQPPQRFLTHGIWPYSESIGKYTNRHPQFCTRSPACEEGKACAMSEDDIDKVLANADLRALVPSDPAGMFAHEWKKHGTCSGQTMEQYFQNFVTFRKAVTFANEAAFKQTIGRETMFSDIRKAFPANTAFRCYKDATGNQYLHEVFYLIDNQGEPYLKEHNLQIGVQCAEQNTWIPRGKL